MTFTADPSQSFTTIIDEETYDFLVTYNANYDYYIINISQNGIDLVNGIKLVTRTDLTKQYKHIPFGLRSEFTEDANSENIELFIINVSIKDV